MCFKQIDNDFQTKDDPLNERSKLTNGRLTSTDKWLFYRGELSG